ncbi:cupin [Haloarcula sp. JP-L23]|uniref:cupin n=1 Tax=Haloarcula sp. JP-L23 TaxID=2716717 RepID=UPI00140EBE2C|nr:cupin [Haloarcula sp. JP-L23]
MAPDTPQAVTQQDLEEAEGTPGITRKVAFQTDNNTLVQAHAEAGVSSGWHHHGDRHVYAYLVEGAAVIEYGPDGSERLELETGSSSTCPWVVHRDVNPSNEPQQWIISFVGTGPLVENVDGPDPE